MQQGGRRCPKIVIANYFSHALQRGPCGFAFRSICQTGEIGERLHLLTAAQKLALAGSKVGRSIAKLRLADALIERGSQQSVRRFAAERAGNQKNPQN